MELLQSLELAGQNLLGPVWLPIWTLVKILAIVLPIMGAVAYLTLAERKVIGFMQIRIGPNRVGYYGLLEMLQNNELGTVVAVNGVPLTPDLPQQDYTRRWLTMHRTVPVSLLRPGYNELTITMVSLLPDTQHRNFVWDDFQVRNIRLVRPAAALNQ